MNHLGKTKLVTFFGISILAVVVGSQENLPSSLCNRVTANCGSSSDGLESTVTAHASGIALGADTNAFDMGSQRPDTDESQPRPALHAGQRIRDVSCEGTYPHHLQGICADDDSIYWSFTTQLVKTDYEGKLLKKVPVANHHGDLCHYEGRLYVAVNLGKFNDPQGNADSWIYVYRAADLSFVAKHETREVVHGAGGVGHRNGHFFVVGGLPDGIEENYVYEYDGEWAFVKRHVIRSGHTDRGIQTATFAHDRWWFGCYGTPRVLLVTDAHFALKGRHEFDCSLGIERLANGRFLSASGYCQQEKGCTGAARVAAASTQSGLRYVDP